MNPSHTLFLYAVLLSSSASASVPQEPAETPSLSTEVGEPIVIGHKRILESKVLGETRTLRIALPPGYAEFDRACGVLYLLDGETLFAVGAATSHHIFEPDVLPMIVVGIDNTERTRDLTPPAGEKQKADFPTSGGSAAFRRFLVDEVRPFIESEYRTGGVRILAGHSFGGLFTAETLLVEPEAFTGFLSLSPSLWWNDEALVKAFKEVALDHAMWDQFAWFSMGDEAGMMNAPYEAAAWAIMERAPARFRWGREHFPAHGHWAAAVPGFRAGLMEFLEPIRNVLNGATTFHELEVNSAEASRLMGVELPVGRKVIGDLAQRLSQQGEIETALTLVDDALEKIKNEPYLYFAKANVFAEAERFGEAVETLEQGIERFGEDPKFKEPITWLNRSLVAMKAKAADQ